MVNAEKLARALKKGSHHDTLTHPSRRYLVSGRRRTVAGGPQASNLHLQSAQLFQKLPSLYFHGVQALSEVQDVILQRYQQVLGGNATANLCQCPIE